MTRHSLLFLAKRLIAPLVITLWFLPAASFAWDCPNPNACPSGQVGNIELWANGGFSIQLAGFPSFCTGASATNVTSAVVLPGANGLTPDATNKLLASLLVAKSTGRVVNVYTNNFNQNGTIICVIGALDLP